MTDLLSSFIDSKRQTYEVFGCRPLQSIRHRPTLSLRHAFSLRPKRLQVWTRGPPDVQKIRSRGRGNRNSRGNWVLLQPQVNLIFCDLGCIRSHCT